MPPARQILVRIDVNPNFSLVIAKSLNAMGDRSLILDVVGPASWLAS